MTTQDNKDNNEDFDEQDYENTDNLLAEDADISIKELFAQLLISNELLVTIENHQVEDLKKSLISVKAKENARLKSKGIPVDNSKLTITEVIKADVPEGYTKLHLLLTKPKQFNIAKIETPAGF